VHFRFAGTFPGEPKPAAPEAAQPTTGEKKMKKLIEKTKALVRDEEGATAVEYGIMVAFIAAGIIVAVTAMRDSLVTLFGRIVTALS
jgi:pilus assembly protein Flp/PilA